MLSKNNNCCGLLDYDPDSHQPRYFENVVLQNYFSDIYDIIYVYDKKRSNALIVLCPRLEEWIIETAKRVGINLVKYNLPDDPEKFHRTVNSELKNFEKLLDDLLKHNDGRINQLKYAFKRAYNSTKN